MYSERLQGKVLSYTDGLLNGIDSYTQDARVKVVLIAQSLEQALDEADCITGDNAMLATVQDGVKSCINEAITLLNEL